ncbi:MAG: peptide ABC transporter substrate-binding protein [Panacagrimonas sp.]
MIRVRLAMLGLCLVCSAPVPTLASDVGANEILRRGNGPEVETLDPHKAESVSASNILRDLFEGLVTENPDGSLAPGTAQSWTLSDDLRTYTFHLRLNARWSNGDAVLADDFVAGFRRSADPVTGSSYSQILAPIAQAEQVIAGKLPPEKLGVAALDAQTLRIDLKGPTPYFLGLLTHPSTFPIHRASLAKNGKDFVQPGKLVSNGAYRLRERVIQSHVLLERNTHYWDNDNTAINLAKYLNTEDINSELKRFRAGELDWTSQIPASQGDWIRANMADAFHVHTYLGVYYYGLNLSQPPFKDSPELRRALSLAIDRDVITRKVLGSGEQPATSWVPPGVLGHRSALAQWAGLTREQSLAEARRLYAQAGYSPQNPARVEIRYNTHDDHKKLATAVAAMWKQWLGVETTLINEEWKVYLQNRRLKARTQVFRAGWIGDYNDANSFLEILQSTHGLNDTGYSSDKYDTLLSAASVEASPERRQQLLSDAERQLLEDLPVIPIYFYVTKRLVAPKIIGWTGNIMDHHASRHFRFRRHADAAAAVSE